MGANKGDVVFATQVGPCGNPIVEKGMNIIMTNGLFRTIYRLVIDKKYY